MLDEHRTVTTLSLSITTIRFQVFFGPVHRASGENSIGACPASAESQHERPPVHPIPNRSQRERAGATFRIPFQITRGPDREVVATKARELFTRILPPNNGNARTDCFCIYKFRGGRFHHYA